MTCHWHPSRETRLRCSRCGKPICISCMRQHPVGVRCKDCFQQTQSPTYRTSTAYVTRALLTALGLGIGGALALLLVDGLPLSGFLNVFILFGTGYLIGEGVHASVNRRRGRAYQCAATLGVACAVGGFWGMQLLYRGTLPIGILDLVGAVVAIAAATSRLRP